MNAPPTSDRGCRLLDGQQDLGEYPADVLLAMARAGTLKPTSVVVRGDRSLTLAQFLAEEMAAAGPRPGGGPGGGPAAGFGPPAASGPVPPTVFQPDVHGEAPAPPRPPAAPLPPMLPPFLPPALPWAGGPGPGRFPAAPTMAPDPGPATAVLPAGPPPADEPADDAPPERDRIVVLGRRQSGKTIYLASVYQKLWKNLDGVTAKALRGDVHKQLTETTESLKRGEWPAATLETRQMEFELEEAGRKRLMVALDYAGEMFANAFVHERMDLPDVKALVDHIDRAAAVILLIDPSIAAGMDRAAATEDEFGLVQAVQRIRNWPGGDEVPVVLVLTKIDQHQKLIEQFGGPGGFCHHYFQPLLRLIKKIAIFQVSAVQVERRPDGRLTPRRDSKPVNVDNPLRYCLRQIHKAEELTERTRAAQEQRLLEGRLAQAAQAKERKQNVTLGVTIAAIILVGLAVIAYVILTG